jgi:lipopolysaccharide/colanic/teichoic acid biosynthesis glycosyltransferase
MNSVADGRFLPAAGRTAGDPRAWPSPLEAQWLVGGPTPVRRALNVAVALLLLLLIWPLMLAIALLVKLSSPGPVIYRQTRVGIDRRRGEPGVGANLRRVDYGGKLFTIYKFRTMTWDPDCTVQLWARRNDPRVTPVGRMLRTCRLDELPQLFNVLRGDMNLVGPRPEQPRLFQELREEIPYYDHRQRVLPGITGWAQVNRGYDGTLEDVRAKVRLDLEYIRRQSAWLDLVILLRTVPVMLFRRGAV